MAFMRPEIIGKQEWAGVETTAGFWWVPIDVLTKSELESARRGDFEPLLKYTEGSRVYSDQSSIKKGYGVRLSAPGYMDSTDWEVYGSKEEALKRGRQLAKEAEGEDYATKKMPALEKKHLLSKHTPRTAKQAAQVAAVTTFDRLNIGDYFNKHPGTTPAQYRKIAHDVAMRLSGSYKGQLSEQYADTPVWLTWPGGPGESLRQHATKKSPTQLDREIAEVTGVGAWKKSDQPYNSEHFDAGHASARVKPTSTYSSADYEWTIWIGPPGRRVLHQSGETKTRAGAKRIAQQKLAVLR